MTTWTIVSVCLWARPNGRVASYYRCHYNHIKAVVLTDDEGDYSVPNEVTA